MSKKIAVFIDGSNLYATAKALAKDVDFKVLKESFGDVLVRPYYYTALLPRGEYELSIIPLIDYIQYNGYKVVSKEAKEFIDASGRKKTKGNMDIEMAVDALEIADQITDAWLFSGDGDFTYLVEALQRRGVRVTVVSSIAMKPPMCADELRRAADFFVELNDAPFVKPKVEKRYG